jgi:hypothetical protein
MTLDEFIVASEWSDCMLQYALQATLEEGQAPQPFLGETPELPTRDGTLPVCRSWRNRKVKL